MSNQKSRVEFPERLVTGPLPGENLLESFKSELIKENILRIMFGDRGERIFIKEMPSLNENILPCIVLSFKNETFSSNNVYLDGFVDAKIFLPARLEGDYNGLRRVANIIQRWMAGSMNLFTDQNPGLIRFGYGSEWNYEGLASFDGLRCPVILVNIPYHFDLLQMRLQVPDFDPNAPLDGAEVGWVEEYLFEIFNQETGDVLIQEGVLVETNKTN